MTRQRTTIRLARAVSRRAPVVLASLLLTGFASAQQQYPVLPKGFLENAGQWPDDVSFLYRRDGVRLAVSPDRLAFVMPRFEGGTSLVTLAWDADAALGLPTGRTEMPGLHHIFLGQDPARWTHDVRMFSSVDWGGDTSFGLEATPTGVRLHIPADRLDAGLLLGGALTEIGDDGTLRLRAGAAEVRVSVAEGTRHWQVSGDRVRAPHNDGGFTDSGPVVPVDLTWGTFLGGGGGEAGNEIARKANGDLFVVGRTTSVDFPVTPGAAQPELARGGTGFDAFDAYLARLSPDGSTLLAATYLGGNQLDSAEFVGLFGSNVIVAGRTSSEDFPATPGTVSTIYGGGVQDAFVARLDLLGTTLKWGTYVGGAGAGQDSADGMLVLPSGETILVGRTCSSTYPVTPGAYDPVYSGECDGFVTRVSAVGKLVFSTYLGGGSYDLLAGVAVVSNGDIVVSGSSGSSDYPTTAGTLDPDLIESGVLTRLTPDGSSIVWSTGTIGAIGLDIFALIDDTILLSGIVPAPQFFQVSPNAYSNVYGFSTPPVLAWITSDGSSMPYSTLWGDISNGYELDTALDAAGRITVVGEISTCCMPVTPDAYASGFSGGLTDGLVQVFDPAGTQLLYGSYLGGGGGAPAPANAVVRDDCGGAIIVGTTTSPAFPVTPGSFDPVFDGSSEAWVARMTVINPWTIGTGGLPGVVGTPSLTPSGDLCSSFDVRFSITRGAPNGTAFLVIGASEISAPFKGGTLVPAPDLVLGGLPLGASGQLELDFGWPGGLPSGLDLWFQVWIPDAAGVFGFSATRSVVGRTP